MYQIYFRVLVFKSFSRIHCLLHITFATVSAFRDDLTSVQTCQELENSLSPDTEIAGIAKKSLAMRLITGNMGPCCCAIMVRGNPRVEREKAGLTFHQSRTSSASK